MSVTQRLMRLGSFRITLSNPALKDEIDYFDHVVIVPGGLRQPDRLGDAGILSVARYSGIVRSKRVTTSSLGDRLEISGQGPEGWLGDEDQKGFIYETPRVYDGDTFAQVLDRSSTEPFGLLRDDAGNQTAIRAGTIHSVAGTYTATHVFTVQRSAIRYVCDIFGAEYRVNPDFTIDAGLPDDLYVTSPAAVLARKLTSGRDPNWESPLLSSYDAAVDVDDYSTRTILLAEGTGETIKTGEADAAAIPYLDPHGNPVNRTRMISEAETSEGNATARAQLHLNRFSVLRRSLLLSTADFDIEGSFAVGDTIYVYDPEDDQLIDVANEVRFRGQTLHPAAIRVLGITWPVTDGMAVYVRHGDGTYLDITDSVEWETGERSSIEVGANPRALTGAEAAQILSGRINTDPDGNDATIPDVPAKALPWGTFSYQDTEGKTRAAIVAEWSQPLNTDASTITDGSHYSVRWRRQGDTSYSYSTVGWGIEIFTILGLDPGIAYEISVAAYDIWGKTAGFGTDETVVASEDAIPPSTPAPPLIAGNPLHIQVVHELGKATGGTFNLEADLDHLQVHGSTESGFTPTDATLLGKLPANSGHLSLGIKAVGTFPMTDTTERFIKVLAVDRAGNASDPSEQATVTAELIGDQHISNLSASKLTAGTIDTGTISIASLLEMGADGIMQTAGFTPGGANGWQVKGDGTSTFLGTMRVGGTGVSEAQFFIDNILQHINIRETDDPAYPDWVWVIDANDGLMRFLSVDESGASPDFTNYLEISKAGQVDVIQGPLRVPDGSLANPAVRKVSAADGMSFSAGVIHFSLGGAEKGRFGSEGIQTINGTSGAPSYGFINDIDTGMFRQAANQIGFATAGTERARITALQFQAPFGSEANPGLSFLGSTGLGFRRVSGSVMRVVQVGVDRWQFDLNQGGSFHTSPGGSPWTAGFTDVIQVALSSEGIIHATRSNAVALFLGRNDGDGGIVDFRADGSQIGSIARINSGGNVQYNTSSDQRLKTNVRDHQGSLKEVLALRVRDFDWAETGQPDTALIAQEVWPVIPHVVTRPGKGIERWMVDYGKLTPWLAGAIQELAERVERLEAA